MHEKSYGTSAVDKLVEPLAQRQVTIVNGLALGTDALAHRAALRAGGITVSVLAGRLDIVHPRQHSQLAKQIIESGGALISEYAPGVPPRKDQFVARNRIVSGLTQAALIIEAARKSGTLHTANFALEQGRSVLAVPGNITSPAPAGTNRLISQGARPVLDEKDIFDELGLAELKTNHQSYTAANEQEPKLLKILVESGIVEGRELLARSDLQTQVYNQTMTILELSGKIRPLGAYNWALR